MTFKKFVAGAWVDTPSYIYNNDVEEFSSFPFSFYGNGENISNWSIEGNTEVTETISYFSINPNVTRYIPVENLSTHFNKNFNRDYIFFSLFYMGYGSDPATNFFYWERGDGVNIINNGNTIEIIYTSGDQYDIYNESYYPNDFMYDLGHANVPYRFVFNFSTKTATLYDNNGNITWSSPICEGYETNAITYKEYIYESCGDRTFNLAPPLKDWFKGYINSDGLLVVGDDDSTNQDRGSAFIPVQPNTDYIFYLPNGPFPSGANGAWRNMGFYTEDKTFISRISEEPYDNTPLHIITPQNCYYVKLSYRNYNNTDDAMFIQGSTVESYESYYKISFSYNNQNYALSPENTWITREIKKIILTGKEPMWTASSSADIYQLYTVGMNLGGMPASSAMSNIAPYGITEDNQSNVDFGCFLSNDGGDIVFQLKGLQYQIPTAQAWRDYLAQQYAQGTPVIIWYILSSPSTLYLNEPMMGIDNYKDNINSVWSGITLSTNDGSNDFDTDMSVQFSEVEIQYQGWHPLADIYEYNNQWN